MLKLLVGIFGLIELLYPERFIRALTRVAYEYEGDAPVAKPWVVTAARIEGLVILGVVIYAALKPTCSCRFLCRSAADSDDDTADDADGDTVDRID